MSVPNEHVLSLFSFFPFCFPLPSFVPLSSPISVLLSHSPLWSSLFHFLFHLSLLSPLLFSFPGFSPPLCPLPHPIILLSSHFLFLPSPISSDLKSTKHWGSNYENKPTSCSASSQGTGSHVSRWWDLTWNTKFMQLSKGYWFILERNVEHQK